MCTHVLFFSTFKQLILFAASSNGILTLARYPYSVGGNNSVKA